MSIVRHDHFHTGIVVADIDASAAELTAIAGLTWSPRLETEVPIWAPGGTVTMRRMSAVYSVEAPHLELITDVPGSLWTVSDRPVHHFGYWSDDLRGESAELERRGLPRVAAAVAGGEFYGFSYHTTRDGLLIELVDRNVFPDWEGFLRGRTAFAGRSAVTS